MLRRKGKFPLMYAFLLVFNIQYLLLVFRVATLYVRFTYVSGANGKKEDYFMKHILCTRYYIINFKCIFPFNS